MKSLWVLAFCLLGGVLAVGLLFLTTTQPRGEAIPLSPPPSPAPLMIHVAGAVSNPGVYPLAYGSRVRDAVQAAGGLLPQADTSDLNLAFPLEDGQRISIPAKAPVYPAPQGAAGPSTPESASPVDINRADQQTLEGLPRIGPVTAQAIIAYREAHGPFAVPEDIQDVPGIGPATYAQIKDLITVSGGE